MEEESHTLSLIKLNLGKASQWSPNGSLVDLSWKHEFQLPDGQRLSHTGAEGMTNVLTAKHHQVLEVEQNNLC